MDNPRGTVLSLVDGPDGARAIVNVDAAVACPRCAAGKGCGAGLFASDGGKRQVEASVRPDIEVAANDVVEIVLAPQNLLRAAFIVYGLPLLGAAAGAAIAYTMSLGDAGAALAAVAGLAAGLVLGRWRLRKATCLQRFLPIVERRIAVGSGTTV